MRAKRPTRDSHGAAIVEALVVLPVLTLVLVAVPLVHALHASRLQALHAARRCGFAHALSGCRELPAACRTQPRRDAAPAPESQDDVAAIARDAAGGGPSVFDDLPLLASALDALLGETIEARAEVELPGRAGAGRRTESALILVCNEQPREVLDVARALFCRHLPLFDCGGRDDR